MSLTNVGPRTKLIAVPMYDARDAIAVAVVLWFGGNQVLEITVAEAWPTGPPRPIINCPMWIRGVATSGSSDIIRMPVPTDKKKAQRRRDTRKPGN